MEKDVENEAVDIESIDDSRPTLSMMDTPSSSSSTWYKSEPRQYSQIEMPKDLDPESQKLIEKMLREERKYVFGRADRKMVAKQPEKMIPKLRDDKVSHKQRWTEEERKLFLDAVKQYGHRWKKIAEVIGTRTPQQVKSFSRYVSLKGLDGQDQNLVGVPKQLDKGKMPVRAVTRPDENEDKQGNSGEQVKIKSSTESDEDEEIDILNDSEEENSADDANFVAASSDQILTNHGKVSVRPVVGEQPRTADDDEDGEIFVVGTLQSNAVEVDLARSEVESPLPEQEKITCSLTDKESTLDEEEEGEEEEDEEEEFVNFMDDAVSPEGDRSLFIADKMWSSHPNSVSPGPSNQGIILDRNVITEEERLIHGRFFMDYGKRKADNPERYLLIRNTILDKWESSKPRYVTKAVIRNSIGKCDVNSIGSIHDYLEQIGAINYINQEEQKIDISEITEDEKSLNPDFFLPMDRPRTKTPEKYLKIRNFFVNLWESSKPAYISKTIIRGSMRNYGDVTTISRIHKNLEELGLINVGVENPYKNILSKRNKETLTKRKELPTCSAARKSQRSCLKQDKKEEDEVPVPEPKRPKKAPKARYDPFKLLECRHFNESNPAPFAVTIEADALALMDLHAHLSSTEVIGLLGGNYEEHFNQLIIKVAKPCKSLSTGLQCEMDPVSQTEASVQIMSHGHQVVGWYHSHPAFLPNPSVRDVETQAEFQSWFGQGGAPFVGIIISPYQRSDTSMINCLMVKQVEYVADEEYQPFQFDFSTNIENANPGLLVQKSRELMEMFQGHPAPILMNELYNNTCTYLTTTLSSICSHYQSQEHKQIIQEELRRLLLPTERENDNNERDATVENTSDHDHG
ncbi:Histone H2A deubiquitinase MYSM1 [Apostichopus japonicus]|uniref:Myb-like, SWIRM and MPN domain-containing protein 1 n=1 Tax=Stichopus japonicus TaxID=307972 RepID=A0A2G8K7L0_STIJA|nr:Histone H2A deubiquitinase MYSM1 [Apostichopus japonicus]